ncbi:MAG: copper homeostasis protein CutC [Ferruginibacter sp.]
MPYQLEVIAFNIECCKKIEKAGAQRIELCANPLEGGTTPSYGFIKTARQKVSIQLFPIIRPRGGDFFYTADEFAIIKNDVIFCKEAGCDGVVIGILNADGSVDKKRCQVLVDMAYPMEVTFHRAFDRAADPFKALEDIIEVGCSRILTSGQQATAMQGITLLENLVKKADERIIIMLGSGVRSTNIIELAVQTGAVEFHTSARMLAPSKMDFVSGSIDATSKTIIVDENEVEKMVLLLQSR